MRAALTLPTFALHSLLLACAFCSPWADGQTPPSGGAEAVAPASRAVVAPLPQRQQAVRERLARLEATLLSLSRALAEREPDKAEKLREALELIGQRGLRVKLERLVAMLRGAQFGDADRGQTAALADLEALLALLTSSGSDPDQRRAERQRLEQLKRQLRSIFDRQQETLQRTQALERAADPTRPDGPPPAESSQPASAPAPTPEDKRRAIRELERAQRDLQRETQDVARGMRPQKEGEREPAGAPETEQARQNMGGAADRLAEDQPRAATPQQEEALRNLQQALDNVDDALRQARREEAAETLAALQARFRGLLERELQILETTRALDAQPREGWTRAQQLQLTDAARTQVAAAEEISSLERMLRDEGTTVILPELTTQLQTDAGAIATRLSAADTGPATQAALEGVCAALREILEAIDAQRNEQEQQAESQEQQESDPDASTPLLPGSAELKLLRGAQLRINERTAQIAAQSAPGRETQLAELGERQRRLAELTQRMSERK